MTASESSYKCQISDLNTRLLKIAEELAHFGSWEFDTSQPRAIWSSELFRIFGLEPKEAGLTWAEYTSFIHPDDLPMAVKNMQIMLGADLNHKENFDYRIIKRDGSVRIIHSQRQVKEIAPDGKSRIIVGVDQDVTDQKQAQDALRQSEERFRIVAEAANVLVYEANLAEGDIQVIRGEKELLGYEPEESGKRKIEWSLSRVHPEDVPRLIAVWNEAIANPEIDRFSVEYRLRHKDGNYITVKDTAKAVKDRNGKTVLFIGGIRDITQRKLDQEKIEEYSKHLEELVKERTKQLITYERLAAIGQVAGMIGHDIRNPLQAIVNEVYFAKEAMAERVKDRDTQSAIESLRIIEDQTDYISKIVSDLQDYARPLKPDLVTLNVCEVMNQALKTISMPGNIHTNVFCAMSIPLLMLDVTYMRRVLTNLINNAIQAMPNGGELVLSASREGDKVLILLQDTGVGIPEEAKPKIFSPMFTTKAKGQGLGLAVVKRLVEAQGGSISFESEEGKGTKFMIEFSLNKNIDY